MRSPTSTRGWPVWAVGLVLLAGLLLVGLPAFGQAIKVTSAVPDTTEQGVVGLVVAIAGDNFASGAKVNFYITGTKNPGGIAVKSVKFKDAKNLEATIDVAADAQTELKFDIEVRCNGRTGKGTELFRVSVKTTGGDLTPPGTVITPDLHLLEAGFNTATLAWTAPANDGFDAASGPAASYDIRVRRADCGAFTPDIWGTDKTTAIHSDPCHVYTTGLAASAPGTPETRIVSFLAPNTSYLAVVRTVDASPQGPNWSPLPDPSLQLIFTTGTFPPSSWTGQIVDSCPVLDWSCSVRSPRLDIDLSGGPTILYTKAHAAVLWSRTGSGSWMVESVGAEIDTSNYMYELAVNPLSQQPTITNVVPVSSTKKELRLYTRIGATTDPWMKDVVTTGDISLLDYGFDPFSSIPTVVYQQNAKGSSVVRVAQRHGATWTIEDAAWDAGSRAQLAFDPSGDPAVSFVKYPAGVKGIGFALRLGGTWVAEVPAAAPGSPWNVLNSTAVAFDPLRGDFAVAGLFLDDINTAGEFDPTRIDFCERTAGAWSCATIVQGSFLCTRIAMAFGPDGTAYLAYTEAPTLFVMTRKPGTTSWTREIARWDALMTAYLEMRVGPDGQPTVAYPSDFNSSGAGGRDISVSLARRTAPVP